ncbi:MAG: UbiA family prenyltransferase [Candidatus Bathyarchaeales archaeon]
MAKATFKGILKLLRLPYWLMTGGLSLLTLAALQKGNLELSASLLTFFSMASLSSAGFSINDFFDKESDAVIKPTRPIPSGEVSPKLALGFSAFLFLLALFLSSLINWLSLMIVMVDAVLLILYSAYIKRKSGFAANILVGCLTGTAFLYGEAVGFGKITLSSLSLYPISFGTIGGNILRDILSLDGDSKVGYPTLPQKIGISKSVKTATLFFIVCALLTPLPYLFHVFGEGYLTCMLIWSLLILYSSASLLKASTSLDNIRKSERLMTMAMILIPLALIVEVFI